MFQPHRLSFAITAALLALGSSATLGADSAVEEIVVVGIAPGGQARQELRHVPYAVQGATAQAYGVLRDWKLTKIAARQSFLVDPEGNIAKHYAEVDPETHTQEVLADLQALMEAAGQSS